MIVQISCQAKGVFHVTVPAPPKVSIFKSSSETLPSVSVSEDSTESQSFIITLPPEAFQQKTTQGVVQKTCSEILTVTSTDQTMVLSSSIAITDTEGGCQISFTPIPNAAGDLQFIASSNANPTDQFNIPITITNTNDAPTDISLSSLSLAENAGPNALVANLSATDPDLGDTFTYGLVAGAGSTENNLFNIVGNQLQMISSADFETKSSYSVRLRATDQGGLFFEKQFPITITNVNEAPVISAIASQTTSEDTAVSVALTAYDIDGSLTCTGTNLLYTSSDPTLVAASGAITWSGIWPNCSALIRPVLNASGTTSVTMTLSDGFLSSSETFLLNVSAVNDPPVISDVTDKSTSQDTVLSGVSVSISDPDSSLTCGSITASSSSETVIPTSGVTISGTAPNCLVSLTPASGQTGTSTITLTVSDGSLTVPDTFVLTVSPVNSAPTDISVSSLSLAENAGANAVVGSLSATDPDPGDTFSYSLVAGTGSNDNNLFNISGNQLQMISSADFETKSSYSVSLRVTDQGGLFIEKQLTIMITNVNEAPSVLAVANQTINQDTPTTPIAIGIIDVDGPLGQCDSTYLSYTSQNPSVVVATGAVSWSGTWPSCTAVITPVTGASGSSVISISASDGSLTGLSQSFNLQVGSIPAGWYQEAYIKASNANANVLFGYAVSLSGDTAIVGSYGESSNQATITNGTTSSVSNTLTSSGASFIYRRTGSSWAQEAYLKASNVNSGDYFGWAVSLSGDTAIVGASFEGSNQTTVTNGSTSSADNSAATAGASYIYQRNGSLWVQEAYLKASNANSSDNFGWAASISGDTAIVGAKFQRLNQAIVTNGTTSNAGNTFYEYGASYIFRRTGSSWAQEAFLKAPLNSEQRAFGYAVSISGNTALIGEFSEGLLTGASYVYRRIGSSWAQEAYIKASNEAFNYAGNFSTAVSLSGDTAIIGAQGELSSQTVITNGTGSSADSAAPDAGASYVYRRTGSGWTQEAYLKASNANISDYFGRSVSISGDTAIVGANGEASNQTVITNGTGSSADNTFKEAGASYVYRRLGSSWAQEAYIKASNANAFDGFGYAVSISGDTALVGAYGEDSNQITITNGTGSSLNDTFVSAGAVYVYRNVSRMFEPYDILTAVTSSSFTINWKGSSLGSSNGNYKVVYSTTIPAANCSTGTLAYTGPANSITINSGLTPGQRYMVRICSFDGATYSEGVTTEVTVKGDEIGPTIVSITRGSTINPVQWGTSQIDYLVTFSEPVIRLTADNFSLTDVTSKGASGQISNISCDGAVCTVWVLHGLPGGPAGNTAELRLDLTSAGGVIDYWGNPLTTSKMGDETFTLSPGWAQEAYLKASNANDSDVFGSAVSLSEDTAIVGAPWEASNQTTITNGTGSSPNNNNLSAGAAYIYKRTGSLASGFSWAQEAYLKASNSDAGDSFGRSVSISGDTAVVGAYGEASNQTTITNGTGASLNNRNGGSGASYVFRRTITGWSQEAYLKASNSDAGDSFGYAVSLSGDTVLVGANQEASNQTIVTNGTTSSANDTAAYAGASYIYRRTGTVAPASGDSWDQEAYIKATNTYVGQNFGCAVSLSGDTAIVGAYGEASNQTTITNGTGSSLNISASLVGSSYIYRRTGSIASGYSWGQEAYLKASNAEGSDYFGWAVALSGDTAIVGANYEGSSQTTVTNGLGSSLDNSALYAGASYIYRRTFDINLGYSWTQEAYLKASNAYFGASFGNAVSLSGDTAIVAAVGEASNQTVITHGTTSNLNITGGATGASYIYRRSGINWAQEAYVKASNANPSDLFGISVSTSGDTAIVGAYGEASIQTTITNGFGTSYDNSAQNAGAVYVYRRLSRIFDPDLRVSAKTTTSITLNWGSNLGSAPQVKIAPTAFGNANPVACTDSSAITLAPGVTTYTYSGLTTGTKYAFRVCGFDGTNVGEGAIIREDTN